MTTTPNDGYPPTWSDVLEHLKHSPPKHVLAFDPGETTGFARFEDGYLTWSEQLNTPTVMSSATMLNRLITAGPYGQDGRYILPEVVVENYQVFKWRAKQHVGDTLHTPRMIGCIETICALKNISLTKQTPQNAKTFVTDDKMKAWNMYVPGQPHARDAIRHGIFYVLFHKQLNSNPN